MKQIKIYTITLIIIFCACGSSIAGLSENQFALFDLINQIRTTPFSYARSLGYDTVFLEETGILPDTAFEPYVMDACLNSGAVAANISSDEENTGSLENGPVHLLTAETGGVVRFLNFMPAEIAGKIVIESLFKQELENKNFQYILSTDYAYAGISIKSGLTEDKMNAWFFTICLKSSVLKSEIQVLNLKSEIQVLNLINQVRSEPWSILTYIDREQFIDASDENRNVFQLFGREYSPLFFNPSLRLSAGASSLYVRYGTYPEPLSFPMAPLERSMYYGYNGPSVQESVVAAVCEKENTLLCVNKIFSALVLKELKTWPEDALVFSSEFQDAGLEMPFLSEEDRDIAVLSFDAGAVVKDEASQISRIYGILFWDNDGDNLYSPGEEIAQEPVLVYDEEMKPVKSVVTDNAGHFSTTLELNKNYFFSADLEGTPVFEKKIVATDQFVKLSCTPPQQ